MTTVTPGMSAPLEVGYGSFEASGNLRVLGRGGRGNLRREESPQDERRREEPLHSCGDSA